MFTFSTLGTLGRLGNQLFEVASTIGLAKKYNSDFAFPEWKYSQYFKGNFPVQETTGTRVNEKHYHYEDPIKHYNSKETYDLRGYFQSEKYWIDNKQDILKQFEFTDELTQRMRSRFDLTSKTLAISVRRGDFVNNRNYFQLEIDYYLQAYYKYFGSEYKVIMFSDDMTYCRRHFSALPNVHFAEGSDIEQLCLMSMCENHIISNSTFSWWGAYLSGSKNVIRPVKNLGPGLPYSEKDYWQEDWKVFEPSKYDLSNTTFVIPVFYDHRDRRHNLLLTVALLFKHFNTNIIIGEQGGRAFEFMQDYEGVKYVQFTYKEWHRTRMINEMCKLAKTPVTVNWDCDNMMAPAQLIEAVKAIENGADIAYPFDGNVYRFPRYLFAELAKTADVGTIDIHKCKHSAGTSVGHGLLMNNEKFLQAGGENEKFISWGPEDSERYDRFNILELKVKRIKGPVFHLDHYIGPTSCGKHPYFRTNIQEHNKIKAMKKTELEKYIATW